MLTWKSVLIGRFLLKKKTRSRHQKSRLMIVMSTRKVEQWVVEGSGASTALLTP